MKTYTINQANMAYLDEGNGHPLLMGHSYLWDARMWQPQIQYLQTNYRCIAPDLWSHGQSDPLPQHSYSIATLAEEYWQFTQTLSLAKFAVIGLSVGGMWATQLALNYPQAISALVLMDTYVGAEPKDTQQTYLGMMDELEQDACFTEKFAAKVAPYFFAKNTGLEQPQLVTRFIDSLLTTPPSHITGKVALGRAIFTRTCLLEKLRQIHIPTLIIVGEEDLPRPPKEAREMTKLLPNARLEIIPKSGHICTVEQPDYVNEILEDFLQRFAH